jgi:hypothetical protein
MDQSQISTEKPAFGRHKFELHERSLLGICSQSSLGGSSLRNGSAHGAVLRLPAQKFQNVIVSCIQRRGGHGEGGVPIGQRTTSHVGLTGKLLSEICRRSRSGRQIRCQCRTRYLYDCGDGDRCSKLMSHVVLQCVRRLWFLYYCPREAFANCQN